MQEAERLKADIQTTYELAREQTNKAEKTLFLPNNKVGDADAALAPYQRSEALLNDLLTRWKKQYDHLPALFAMIDEVRARNARGLAFVALAKGDTQKHAQYRLETIDISRSALDHIASASFENPQFPWMKQQFQRHLSEAHLWLYIHYLSGDPSKAQEHLKQARQIAPDPETKTMIDRMTKPK